MRATLLFGVFLLSACAVAAEIAPNIDGPFRSLFKDANVINIERREVTNWLTISMGLGSHKDVYYDLILSDGLNKKFKVSFKDSGELVHSDTYKTRVAQLPAFVQNAVEAQAPGTPGDTMIEAKVKYLRQGRGYKISGKANGTKISVEVSAPTKIASRTP